MPEATGKRERQKDARARETHTFRDLRQRGHTLNKQTTQSAERGAVCGIKEGAEPDS